MSGRRKHHGRPTRVAARIDRMRQRLVEAMTAEEQLAYAFDWFRAAVKHVEGGDQAVRDMAQHLADVAYQLDRDKTLRRAG